MSRILPIELKEFNATALDGTDQNFGSALSNPAIKISVFNTSDVDVYMDYDGVIDLHMRIPAGGTITLDESTLYFRGIDQEYYLPKNSQLTLTQVTGAGALGSIIAHIVTRQMP
jgi:hypothetical protein